MTTHDPVEDGTHVVLSSHSNQCDAVRINWGAREPLERGPIIGTISNKTDRNVIGTHGGSYTVYRALSIASGHFPADHRPDLTDTGPAVVVEPQPSWFEPGRIVSLDPWGAHTTLVFREFLDKGISLQPTIAITQAHLTLPEIHDAIEAGRLEVDGEFVTEGHDVRVTKIAIDPVWHLPSISERFEIKESTLRTTLFSETGGMFPELVTRPDLDVWLPPIGSSTAYVFGRVEDLADPTKELTCRVHDECNGSDVFGSDICTCRPYLTFGIEDAVRTAQQGGVGIVVYFRKEGRALGEVTKFLVYNARKRQPEGDNAATYFERTECVAGVQDARFQEFMPDVLNYFGITKINNLHSMSNMKYDAITAAGISVVNRIEIPDKLIPADAQVEIEAKKAAGYFSDDDAADTQSLKSVKGRDLT
ncbi:MAG: GTP cyclohydrolase II [Gammaproteobacteria bacterium]